MNKNYRLVWSEARRTFVVAHEKAKARGKSSHRKAVVRAVAAALLALSETAFAGGSCPSSGTNTITGSTNSPCLLTGTTATGLINQGTISASPAAVGVSGANNTITNSGAISGSSTGIAIFEGTVSGGITNSGTISGGYTGISIYSGSTVSGGITNSGAISGTNFAGIDISRGSTVSSIVNQGTISGGVVGIRIISGSTVSGGITNSGTISGDTGIVIIDSTVSGGITNSGTLSTIHGGNYGILITSRSSVGNIVNQGAISGGDVGISIYNGSTVSGGITDSGTISGFTGIRIAGSTVSGSITNSGTISGGSRGIVIANHSTVSGITNSGTISGGHTGIGIVSGSTVSGGITDSGTISGTNFAGIVIDSGSSVSNIVNQSTISGGTAGIRIDNGSTVSGGITNSGTLSTIYGGNGGIAITGSSVSSIVNQGVISGNNAGIGIFNGTVSGSITNSDAISGGSEGIVIFNGTVSGGITNSSTLSTIHGGEYGILISESSVSSIVNQGTISGTNVAGIDIFGSTVSGGITNSGTLSTIYGGDSSIVIGGSSVSNIVNQSTISGGDDGIGIFSGSTVSGGITNSGTISGGLGAGISIFSGSTVSGGITNSGAISGNSGIAIIIAGSTVSGGITNSGTLSTIHGGQVGILITGGSSVGSIVNQGTISGGSVGIDIFGSIVNGGITNSGTISGGSTGIAIVNGSTVSNIVNQSTISGGVTGIGIYNGSTVSGGITNSGTISGSTYAVLVDSTSSLGSLVIAGNNTAAFAGEVDAPATPVTVAAGATYTLNNGNFFNVQSFTNAGTLKIGAGSIGTISGTFTNSGTYNEAVASLTSYGELVVHGTANLGGSLLVNVIGAPTLANHTTLSGVIAATTIEGTFASVSTNSSIFTFTPLYSGDDLDLVVGTSSPTPVVNAISATGPGLGAAEVLDQLLAAGCGALSTVCTRLGELTSAQQVSNAVSQLLPLLDGSASQVTLDMLLDIQQIVQERIAANNGLASGASFFGDQTFWMRPFGSWINQSNSGSVPGYSATVGGVALGADGAPSDTARVGLSFAYANADVTSNSAVAPNNDGINLYQLMAYGSLALDSVTTVDYQLDGGTDANSGERRIIFVGKSADADYNTYTAHAGFGINRSFTVAPQDTLTTTLRVDYTHLHDPGYTETGAGVLDLSVAPNSTEQLLWSADVKNAYTLEDGITLLAHAGVGYDSFNRQASTVAAFAGAPDLAFTTYGITTSPWLAQGGVGLEKQFGNGWTVAAHYDGELRTGFNDQSVSLNVRWLF